MGRCSVDSVSVLGGEKILGPAARARELAGKAGGSDMWLHTNVRMRAAGQLAVLRGTREKERPAHREDLLAGAPEQNSAGLGVSALRDECEVLIPDFLDFQQACSRPDVVLSQLLWAADYPGPTGSSERRGLLISDAFTHL